MPDARLTEEDISLSVMHHSLPIPVRAAVESLCPEEARRLLDYALLSDAGRLCGVEANTIRHWIKSERMPSIRWHNGKVLVRVSDVRRLRDNPPQRGRPAKKIPA